MIAKDSINFQLHTISAQKLYSCSTNGSPCMMYYYYHSYYYYYILLPILLYIRKSVHQKCMIILWYYIQNWQLLERVVQVKMVKNVICFVWFFEKKKMSFCFLMIVCHFFECIFDFWTKKCYLWLIFIIIVLRKFFVW